MGLLKKAAKAWKDMRPPGFDGLKRSKDGKLIYPKKKQPAIRTKKQKEEDTRASKNVAKPWVIHKGYKVLDGVGSLRSEVVRGTPPKTSMKKKTKGKPQNQRKPLVEEMRKAYKNRAR